MLGWEEGCAVGRPRGRLVGFEIGCKDGLLVGLEERRIQVQL